MKPWLALFSPVLETWLMSTTWLPLKFQHHKYHPTFSPLHYSSWDCISHANNHCNMPLQFRDHTLMPTCPQLHQTLLGSAVAL